jgi:uncharacterized protein
MGLTRRSFLLGCAGCGVTAIPLGWYSAAYEPGDLEVTHHAVAIRGLSAQLNGVRMAQVSDLHVIGLGPVHIRMAEQLQSLNPDLIVVTGDLVDISSAVTNVVDLLGSFSAPLGTWAVPGNWDHTADAIGALKAALPSANVQLLTNESRRLQDGPWIVGADDPATGHADLAAALGRVGAGVPRILLAHSPDIVASLRDASADLVLCGHTHGGQINLPFLNGAWLKDGATRRYVEGFYDAHGSPMYVNRGIGTTTLPLRVACRPELTIFTLHSA